MKAIKFLAYAFLVPSIFIFTSCLDNEVTDAADEAIVLQIEKEVSAPLVGEDVSVNAESLVKAFIASSAAANGVQRAVALPKITITSDGDKFPKVYEINYGDEYYDSKGNLLSGIVILTKYSYKESEIAYKNFYFNKNYIQGYRRVSAVETGILYITAEEVVNEKTSRNFQRTRTLIHNNKTEDDYSDDSYQFTGSCEGVTYINGKEFNYNLKIENPLIKASNWKYFVQGVSHLTIGESIQTIDYGEGKEDNIAIRIKNGGEKKEIYLKW